MSLEAALYAELAADSGVAAIVGVKIYPAGSVPMSADLPYVTYQKVSNEHVNHQGGSSSMARPRMQIDCWAASGKAAVELYEAVRAALDNFSGTMGSGSNTATVKISVLETDSSDFERPGDKGEGSAFRQILEFLIWQVE